MQQTLIRVQNKFNKWIGSNVIHLGDHNVYIFALTFIDKYVQVPRILFSIVNCLENLERLCEEDDSVSKFIEAGFGGVEQLKNDILYDFFQSAFDGSGADNFYDAVRVQSTSSMIKNIYIHHVPNFYLSSFLR